MLASLLDGFTLVLLVPLLKHLFGTAGSLRAGSTQLEALIDRLVEPLMAGLTPGQAAARLVVLLVLGLVLKNAMSYASTQSRCGLRRGWCATFAPGCSATCSPWISASFSAPGPAS